MVLSGLALADTLVFQTGQGGKNVNGRHISLAVHFTGKNDLSLGDVSGKVGNGVSFVVLGHGQDRDHGDGALASRFSARTLVHGCKVGVKVTGVTAPAGNFLSCRRNLTQSFCVVGDVGHNDKNVHVALKGQIFCCRQRHTGRGNTLDSGVGGKVDKEDGTVDSARLLKVGDKEVRFLKGDTDSGENNGELTVGASYLRLSCDLCRKVSVRHTGARENGELLAANQGVQTVNGRNTRLNELGGVDSGRGVNGSTVDVELFVGNDLGAAVNGGTHSAENSAEHIGGNGQLNTVARKANLAFGQVKSRRALEKLNENVAAVYLKDLATANVAVGKLDLAQLVVFYAVNLTDKHQRTGNLFNGFIFSYHAQSSFHASFARLTASSSCCAISASIFLNSSLKTAV